MITGYNTDIEHGGVVYHVQTEDKGLETPLILSLVYAGGAILASKRTRYEDLIASGFTDEALSERVTRQHKLICAAIHAGRLADLKRMAHAGETLAEAEQIPEVEAEAPAQVEYKTPPKTKARAPAQVKPKVPARVELKSPPFVIEVEVPVTEIPRIEITDRVQEREDALAAESATEAAREAARQAAVEATDVTAEEVVEGAGPIPPTALPYTINDPRHDSVMGEVITGADGLRVTLLDEKEFHSGEAATLRIMVSYVSASHERPIADASVSVKVLGTVFRPKLMSARTQEDGVAVVQTQIPEFTSGRAAILIRVSANGSENELRRVIVPG
ncbi:MAG: hypothetical protein ABI967_08765 [bacterium]